MLTVSIDDVSLKNTIVTVGKFDGIHKGHEKLFDTMRAISNGRQRVVLTFKSNPKNFLNDKNNKTIVTENEKLLLCEEQGIDVFIEMPLTKEFLSMSREDFLSEILIKKLGATSIVCGTDFRFGSKASGNVDFLRDNQKKYEYSLVVVEKEQYDKVDISSTVIRDKIASGDIREVNTLLDHPYRIIGKVLEGKQLGRKMDVPTANIIPQETKLLPPNGVYRTIVVVDNEKYHAITNIGINPTVDDDNKIKVETHIIDAKKYLYHETIEVRFYDFIRPERKFENIDELKAQIIKDIEKCRELQ